MLEKYETTKELYEDLNLKHGQFYQEYGNFESVKANMQKNIDRICHLDQELSKRDYQV